MVMVQLPGEGEVAAAASMVPPAQVKTLAPVVAVNVPPEQPVPKALPSASVRRTLLEVGRLSVKLVTVAGPLDQLYSVTV